MLYTGYPLMEKSQPLCAKILWFNDTYLNPKVEIKWDTGW